MNASHRTGLRCHMSNGRQVSPYASDSYYIFLGGRGVLAYTFIIYGNPVKSILSTRKYRACSNLEWTPLNKGLCVCKELMRFFSRTSPICWSNQIWTTIGREKIKSVLPSLPIDKHSSVFQALRIRFSWSVFAILTVNSVSCLNKKELFECHSLLTIKYTDYKNLTHRQ